MNGRPALRLAVLISGRGSNMAAIARACQSGEIAAQIAVVIADRDGAAGIAWAAESGLPTRVIPRPAGSEREAFEAALIDAIDAAGAELVVLAGFMRVLSAPFVEHYAGRMLNIHPSLLPKFKGLHTHQRALAAGEREHGASVHFVTPELDGGPVVCQGRVSVLGGDDEHSLSARVQQIEHRIYPKVIGWIAAGRLGWRDGMIQLDGRPLPAPLCEELTP